MQTVYLIGIGPGDPEMITVKGARLLGEADIVYIPGSAGGGEDDALRIISPYTDAAKITPSAFPTLADRVVDTEGHFALLADDIAVHSREGKKVVYVTHGDAMLYSTAILLARRLRERGVPYSFVAGIPSFTACANIAGIPLGEIDESFLVARPPGTAEEIHALAQQFPTLVFMRTSGRLRPLIEYARKYLPAQAVLIHKAQLEGEKVIDLKSDTEISESWGHLSVAFIKA